MIYSIINWKAVLTGALIAVLTYVVLENRNKIIPEKKEIYSHCALVVIDLEQKIGALACQPKESEIWVIVDPSNKNGVSK